MAWNLCAQPSGYSEQAYTGWTESADPGNDDPYGWHDLEENNCLIDFGWVRANPSDGAPTFARIDYSRSGQISDPDVTFEWRGTRVRSGNFSWGTGRIGIGPPGATSDDTLAAPRIQVQFTADQDIATIDKVAFRGVFVNAAGTVFATDWHDFRLSHSAGNEHTTYRTTLRVHIDGSTGHISASDDSGSADISDSVALSGSFTGDYDRWESWHAGGGGSGTNEGGLAENEQFCEGDIYSIDVAGVNQIRPTVGTVGFG